MSESVVQRMIPAMSPRELACFKGFLSASSNYLEFGCGGSTYLASQLVSGGIISIDSSLDWTEKVRIACDDEECKIRPKMLHVDIGATGDWGHPIDKSTRDRWPSYSEAPWKFSASYDTDLYLIDGRFRVASFMSVIFHCRVDSVILIHDFASRPHYHVIREVAREVTRVEDISAFIPSVSYRWRAFELLNQYRFDPA